MKAKRPMLLLDDDLIQPGDFMRPLDLVYIGQSDYLLTENTYSGSPMNHTRWLQVERAGLGDHIVGKQTVGEFNRWCDGMEEPHQTTTRYEFCRGDLPGYHVMGETRHERQARMNRTKIPMGRHKGKTLLWVQNHANDYYKWMVQQGLDKVWCDR